VGAGITTIGVTTTQPAAHLLQCGANATITDFTEVSVDFLHNFVKQG
jgi:hypothetical protein